MSFTLSGVLQEPVNPIEKSWSARNIWKVVYSRSSYAKQRQYVIPYILIQLNKLKLSLFLFLTNLKGKSQARKARWVWLILIPVYVKIPRKYSEDLRSGAIILTEIVWLNVKELASHLQISTRTASRYVDKRTRIGNVNTAVINWSYMNGCLVFKCEGNIN